MQTLEPTEAAIPYEEAEELWDERLDSTYYDTLVSGEETVVVDEDGNKLLHYFPNTIPQDIRDSVLGHLDGEVESDKDYFTRYFEEDGLTKVQFGVVLPIGHDRELVKPYVSLAEFLETKMVEAFGEKAERQIDVSKRYYQDDTVGDTGYTTIAANYNFESPAHRGKEYEPRFVNSMATLRRGEYSGGILIMPEIGIAFDLHDSDVLSFHGRILHGNTKLNPQSEDATRITIAPRPKIADGFDEMEEEIQNRN